MSTYYNSPLWVDLLSWCVHAHLLGCVPLMSLSEGHSEGKLTCSISTNYFLICTTISLFLFTAPLIRMNL